MSLLDTHLEQIELCSATIAELPFPLPQIFTNAILRTHDITALIRDTESHERALYTLAPADLKGGQSLEDHPSRRATTFGTKSIGHAAHKPYQLQRQNKLITAVLGGDLAQQIQKQNASGRGRAEVDVDVLLDGAEKLCAIYPIGGAAEKITALRHRYQSVRTSNDRYEALVAEQAAQLGRLSRSRSFGGNDEEDGNTKPISSEVPYTEEDMRRDEEGIKELERKKRTLEERLSGMERDLGGLMR